MQNILLIGNDIDKIGLDIWKNNTNYTVINQNPNIWCKEFNRYIRNKQIIVISTAEQFMKKKVNDLLSFCENKNFVPIFIADAGQSDEVSIYNNICEEIPDAILYTKNKNNENYKEFIELTKKYVLTKRI